MQPGNHSTRTLYGFWLSPYLSLVAQMLMESGLDFEYERVSPFLGATRTDAHLSRNAFGKIPSLEESDGLVVSESQAICRYLARGYEGAQVFYPSNDAVACAEVDHFNDFLTFSISGPFFNWFVVGCYWPQAWGMNTQPETEVFSTCSFVMIRNALDRLLNGAKMSPFLLGPEPRMPDFHLFQILQLGKTFAEFFAMPMIDVLQGNAKLQAFYNAMAERSSSQAILAAHAGEREETRREIFEEFGPAYQDTILSARAGLSMLFGREV